MMVIEVLFAGLLGLALGAVLMFVLIGGARAGLETRNHELRGALREVWIWAVKQEVGDRDWETRT